MIDGLADAGTAEHADLAALHVRFEQVDDLDAGLEHLTLRLDVLERRGGRWMGQRVSAEAPTLRRRAARRAR
jgi:hypothetical protein